MSRSALIRAGYVVAGLKIGALWMAQGDSSPWVHALRLLILMAKVTLVALAMAAGLALDTSISHADAWVSVGLAAVAALGGPIIHPWLVKTRAVEDHPTAAAVAV